MNLDEDKLHGELVSGFVSKHHGPGRFRENNTGIGYIHPSGWMLGGYKNSLDKDTFYLGKRFSQNLLGDENLGLEAGLLAALATGYGKPVMPVLAPEIVGNIGDNKLALVFVPPVKGKTPGVTALQFRKRF